MVWYRLFLIAKSFEFRTAHRTMFKHTNGLAKFLHWINDRILNVNPIYTISLKVFDW